MRAIPFDTLEFKNTLLGANVPEAQAEAFTKATSKAFDITREELVTKSYLKAELNSQFLRQFYWILGFLIPTFLSIIGLIIVVVLKI